MTPTPNSANPTPIDIAKLREDVQKVIGTLEFYSSPWGHADAQGERVPVPDFYDEMCFGERADEALPAVQSLPAVLDELERYKQICSKDPNTYMIMFEDGDHQRLSRGVGKLQKLLTGATSRAEQAERERDEYKRQLDNLWEDVAANDLTAANARIAHLSNDLDIMRAQWTNAEDALIAANARIAALEEAMRCLYITVLPLWKRDNGVLDGTLEAAGPYSDPVVSVILERTRAVLEAKDE